MNTQPVIWKQVLRAIHNGEQPGPEQWQALSPDERELIELLQREKLTAPAVVFLGSLDDEAAWLKLNGNIQRQSQALRTRGVRPMRWLQYAAVAAGIFLLGATAFFLLRKDNQPRQVITGTYITTPVNPKRAMLVLANGQSIELNKEPDSTIQQGQTEITNIDTSLLKYTARATDTRPAGFNTLIVPRGGLYKIQLADGSEVWLNAASRLRYPVHFGGVTNRTVFLESGEAYFRIKKNTAQPFIVNAAGVDVRVTGTEFNVNTYTKYHTTTLSHGSVQLSAGAMATPLQPGEQAIYSGTQFIKRTVDVDTYTAWKDGQIIFEETTLEEVMNSLYRQYDFTAEFLDPELKERKFGGRFRKTGHIEDVLTAIGKAGNIQFSIREKTIFVDK